MEYDTLLSEKESPYNFLKNQKRKLFVEYALKENMRKVLESSSFASNDSLLFYQQKIADFDIKRDSLRKLRRAGMGRQLIEISKRQNHFRQRLRHWEKLNREGVKAIKKPEQIFLEGKILHYNQDYLIIYHQKEIGKNGQKLISCLKLPEEKILWSIPQADFPNPKKFKADNPFLFVINYQAEIYGELVVLTFTRTGMLGVDLKTGEVLWKYKAKGY